MDRTSVSGTDDVGSIPTGPTTFFERKWLLPAITGPFPLLQRCRTIAGANPVTASSGEKQAHAYALSRLLSPVPPGHLPEIRRLSGK